MEKSVLNDQLNKITYILFGALCFSTVIFSFLIYNNLLAPVGGSDVSWPSSNIADIRNFGLYAAVFICVANYLFFSKSMNIESLKNYYKHLDLNKLPMLQAPHLMDMYKQGSDEDKKESFLRLQLQRKYIVHWALNEAIAILGIVSIVIFGMPSSYAYYFIGVALLMNFIMRPNGDEIIQQVRAKDML